MSSPRTIGFRAITLLAALLLLAIGFELVLRVVGYEPLALEKTKQSAVLYRESDDRELVYEPVPGAVGAGNRDYVRINSSGFRDDEYATTKPPETLRIAVLGDSITFAIKHPLEVRFTELVEHELRAAGRAVDVLNLGVAGYDTLQEVVFLRRVGLAFEPDLVVVTFCINDLGVHSMNRNYIRRASTYDSPIYRFRVAQFLALQRDRLSQSRDFEENNREERFRRDFSDRIVDTSDDVVLADLREALELYLTEHEVTTRKGLLDWYVSESRIGRLRYALERLRRLSEERGFRVAVLIVPYLAEGEHADGYDLAYEIVGHEAERQGFDILSVATEFRVAGLENVANHGSPLHPNELGHRILADRLRAYVEGSTAVSRASGLP